MTSASITMTTAEKTATASILLLSTVCYPREREHMHNGAGRHLRETNQLLVLNAIRVDGRPTRRRLAEVTGLTFQSIENISKRLIDAGIVLDELPSGSERSRHLTLRPDGAHALGIHRAADAWHIALCDITGGTISEVQVPAGGTLDDAEELRQLARAVADVMDDQNVPLGTVVGAGLTFGETINPDLGVRAMFAEELGGHLRISNLRVGTTPTAALRREQWYGRLNAQDAVFIHLGAEVGCAIISAGQLTTGATGRGGNIAHFTVEPVGELCRCGRGGCLATVLSTAGIEQSIRAGFPGTTPPALTEIAALCTTDRQATAVVERAARYLARTLALVIQILDPAMIAIAGTTAESLGEPFLRKVREHLLEVAPAIAMPTLTLSEIATSQAADAANMILHQVFTPA